MKCFNNARSSIQPKDESLDRKSKVDQQSSQKGIQKNSSRHSLREQLQAEVSLKSLNVLMSPISNRSVVKIKNMDDSTLRSPMNAGQPNANLHSSRFESMQAVFSDRETMSQSKIITSPVSHRSISYKGGMGMGLMNTTGAFISPRTILSTPSKAKDGNIQFDEKDDELFLGSGHLEMVVSAVKRSDELRRPSIEQSTNNFIEKCEKVAQGNSGQKNDKVLLNLIKSSSSKNFSNDHPIKEDMHLLKHNYSQNLLLKPQMQLAQSSAEKAKRFLGESNSMKKKVLSTSERFLIDEDEQTQSTSSNRIFDVQKEVKPTRKVKENTVETRNSLISLQRQVSELTQGQDIDKQLLNNLEGVRKTPARQLMPQESILHEAFRMKRSNVQRINSGIINAGNIKNVNESISVNSKGVDMTMSSLSMASQRAKSIEEQKKQQINTNLTNSSMFLPSDASPISPVKGSLFKSKRGGEIANLKVDQASSLEKSAIGSRQTRSIGLAATNFQYQKQVRMKICEVKRNRFGQEIFNHFSNEINRLRRAYSSKQEIEPIYAHFKVNEDICLKTISMAEKCLMFRKCRAPLEQLVVAHSRYLESFKQHPFIQLFVMLEISKILLQTGGAVKAVPITKFVKRNSFLNLANEYHMKAFRTLANAHLMLEQYEIAFGYTAKYLHLSWCCGSQNNELNAYEMLGKIFYYLGDKQKSQYYHSRMAVNQMEGEESSLKKMQVDHYKSLQKHRYEILASREVRKNRMKVESAADFSLNFVSSDDEGDLNQLIPEQNLLIGADIYNEEKEKEVQQSVFGKAAVVGSTNQEVSTKIGEEQSNGKQIKTIQQSIGIGYPIRTMPKFDIKMDKSNFPQVIAQANVDIGMEQKRRESFEKFLKKPLEQFLVFKNISGIGPMRDRMNLSHKSFNKNLENYLTTSMNERKTKASNTFFSIKDKGGEAGNASGNGNRNTSEKRISSGVKEQIQKIVSNPSIPGKQNVKMYEDEAMMDFNSNIDLSEFWKESSLKRIEKSLKKIIMNIKFFNGLRDDFKKQIVVKVSENRFFDYEQQSMENDPENMLDRINEELSKRIQGMHTHIL